MWQRLPELIADPLYAFQHREGGLDLVIDATTAKGEPLIVGVRDGQVRTITPKNDVPGQSGLVALHQMMAKAIRAGATKIYAKDGKVPAGVLQALRAEPGARRINVISRDDVIERQGRIFYAGDLASVLFGYGRPIVQLFAKANAASFMHETGHIWLEELMSDAADKAATADLVKDAQTVRDWLGNDGGPLTRAQHEQFASGFEQYLMEGRAPTPALTGVFAKFKQWLTKIYQTVDKLGAPINDDIRAVFDRLIAKDPEDATLVAPEGGISESVAARHSE